MKVRAKYMRFFNSAVFVFEDTLRENRKSGAEKKKIDSKIPADQKRN
jgi:hypothetical protein